MSDTLQGQQVKDTYGRLLQIANANVGVDGTLRAVLDGKGEATALSLSTTKAAFGDASWVEAGTGVSAGISWVPLLAKAISVPESGRIAFAGVSRASDVDDSVNSTQSTIGLIGIGVMDKTGSGPPYWTSYGGYFEGRIEAASSAIGTVIGIEIDAINFSASPAGASTPWRMQTLGGATALWLASGGDPANHGRTIAPAQLALGIVDNGETFEAGIVISRTAIEGTDGTTGFGSAINLATRHILGWFGAGGGNGERLNYITSTSTTAGHSIQFQNAATLVLSAGGEIDFAVANVANSVNGIGIVPAATGAAPCIETFGDDTNVPLKIKPKGGGNIEVFADQMLFYSDSGNQLSGLVNSVSSNTYFSTLEFADTGPFIYGRGGVVASFAMVANPVASLSFSNAASGQALSITAQGSGDLDILIDPGGANGTIRLGVPTATSATSGGASALPGDPAGYFKVKDAGGTLRHLPFWNA